MKNKKLATIVATLSLACGLPQVVAPARAICETAQANPAAQVPKGGDGKYDSSLSLVEQSAQDYQKIKNSVYCIRHTGIYERLAYDDAGNVVRVVEKLTAHGTGFVYKSEKNDAGETEYFVATNDHVVNFPDVVQNEYKKIGDVIEIVQNSEDEEDSDNISLELVIKNENLDMAVLKTTQKLNVYPYGLGKSSELIPGNIIRVEGYTLGAFKVTTQGIVSTRVNPEENIDFEDNDFMIDAAINPGNSGSPAFALRDGNWEWVGNAHAKLVLGQGFFGPPSFTEGSAFVVGVDKFRELLDYNKTLEYKEGLAAKAKIAEAEEAKAMKFLKRPITGRDYITLTSYLEMNREEEKFGEFLMGNKRYASFEFFQDTIVANIFANYPLDQESMIVLIDAPKVDTEGRKTYGSLDYFIWGDLPTASFVVGEFPTLQKGQQKDLNVMYTALCNHALLVIEHKNLQKKEKKTLDDINRMKSIESLFEKLQKAEDKLFKKAWKVFAY